MRFFDKENFDLLTSSPGNYIFKNKSNKSEFGKLSSLLHITLSIIILIYNLYSYYKGSGMNVSYSKIAITNNSIELNKKDDLKIFSEKVKNYEIYIGCNNLDIDSSEIEENFDFKIYGNEAKEIKYTKNKYKNTKYKIKINFTTEYFNFLLKNKTQNLICDYFIIEMHYNTSLIKNEEKIPMKEDENENLEIFIVNVNKYNLFYLNRNYKFYRDGIRLKNFKSYLQFWTHDETTYIDFEYNNYNFVILDKINNFKDRIIYFTNNNIGEINYVDFYQRKYDTFFTVLSKWCGIFSTLKILFSSLVLNFSYSFNNYELIKYINKKYESNKILLNNNNNNNNNNDNKENKNIELNKINVDKIKQFNKIKNSDIFKYSFLGCCYSKSKTHNIIKECDKYVTKHISIEEIFYNMLLLENFIEEYKFKDNNLKKFEEIKNKIDLYEKEMKLIDENDTSNKNINNININLIDKTSNFSSINES